HFPVPGTMTGRPLASAIAGAPSRPRAVVLIVLDGMGRATWDGAERVIPTLSRLRREGAWFDAAALDYVPSVTCVGHATVSTGADPRVQGVPGNRPFIFGKLQDPFTGMKPDACRIHTLADDWDSLTAGRAVIAVQGSTPRATVALAGHGAARAGGH